VEVDTQFHKSSYSADTSNCVEVAAGAVVGVRDSKDPAGPVLTFGPTRWTEFVDSLRESN
jgi:hypothetical protein